MEMQNMPSWDLFLLVFFIVSIGYSFILQRDKVVVTMLSIYVGYVVASLFGPTVQDFFQGDKTIGGQLFVRANLNPFLIQLGVFVATTVLISARSGIGRLNRSVLSTFELSVFSVLNATLILTIIFSFMSDEVSQQFQEISRIASVIISRESWWFIAPVIAIIVTGGLSGRTRGGYD